MVSGDRSETTQTVKMTNGFYMFRPDIQDGWEPCNQLYNRRS
jgi:hypothetical protein